MVHADQQDVLFLAQPQQPGPEQRPALQVEGTALLLEGESLRFGLSLGLRQPAPVFDGQHCVHGGGDHLHRLTVHGGKGGAQSFVARDDLLEAPLQRLHLEGATES